MAAPRRTRPANQLPLGLEPRTLFVTGKGGVGKTTVAAAMAQSWRDAGVRTLLVEIAGQDSAAALLSNRTIGYEPTALSSGLHAMRIDLESALREYARLRLKVKMLADRLVGNSIVDQFAQAAPGFRELLVLGKLWSLWQMEDSRRRRRYEAIVVDAPATGHGLGLLGMAGVVARMFPVGPIAAEARAVDAFIRRSGDTGVLLVTLPEEIPVNETLELRDRLEQQGVDLTGVLVNSVIPERFSATEIECVRDLVGGRLAPGVSSALETAIYESSRVAAQQEEIERLSASLTARPSQLPFLYVDELQRQHVLDLASQLSSTAAPRRRRAVRT